MSQEKPEGARSPELESLYEELKDTKITFEVNDYNPKFDIGPVHNNVLTIEGKIKGHIIKICFGSAEDNGGHEYRYLFLDELNWFIPSSDTDLIIKRYMPVIIVELEKAKKAKDSNMENAKKKMKKAVEDILS